MQIRSTIFSFAILISIAFADGIQANDNLSADDLDQEDETLDWEGKRLNQRANDLNGERDRLNADIDRFNQFCAGRPLPPGDYQYCQNERSRLERWKADIDGRIGSHNQEFARWEEKFPPFYSAAAALGQARNPIPAKMSTTRIVPRFASTSTMPTVAMLPECR